MTNHWVAPSKSAFIREIDQYIEQHLSQHITVEDICAVLHIGRTKLYEISMDYLGCGLAEYIRKQRIARAQQMLLQTNASITEIAFLTGFSDYNHFSRIFKKIVGISAREYRKKQS
ncbi:MAG: helix-turn-helix transcriptional regulator [Oscillospiraceae bacterium]|nr:helix-turn-helix transcriptional regulator [Oscillospiraceae bacterium]